MTACAELMMISQYGKNHSHGFNQHVRYGLPRKAYGFMPLLTAAGVNCIGVRDLPAASAWYMEKLGLRKIEIEMDESEGCIARVSPKINRRLRSCL